MKKIILLALLVSFSFSPVLALAQSSNPCSVLGVKNTADKNTALPKCISKIYVWSLGIAALLALLVVVIGAYYYMTSAGNAEQSSTGTEMIWGAIIGLVLLFAAYLLLNTINPDLVNLKLANGYCFDFQTNKQISAKDKADCESKSGKWYSVTDSTMQPTAPRSP